MTSPQFTHLRLHSEYSIVDGLVRVDDVVKAAVKDAQAALAITDLANLFGMVKFYKAARGKGIKPIAGCDVWITNNDERDKPSRLLLLVKNADGYRQLCELLSSAWLTNMHRGRAEIRAELRSNRITRVWVNGRLSRRSSWPMLSTWRQSRAIARSSCLDR